MERPQLRLVSRSDPRRSFRLGASPTGSPWGAGAAERVQPTDLGPPVFVSYASDDRARYVEPLVEHLRQSYSVWADWRSLVPGDPFEDEIEQGLRSCAALIAVLSESSVEREWPLREWRSAVERYFAPVVPFVVEEKALEKRPRCLRHLHYQKAFPVETTGGRAEYRREVLGGLQEALESHLLPRGQVMIDPWRTAAGAGQSPALRPVGRSFVGREIELRRLVRAIGYGVLLYGGTRQEETVIVHGVGGVGKSMLAAELARRIGPRYPGGVILERRGRRPEQDLKAVLCKWSGYLTGTPPSAIEPEVLRRQMHRAGTLLVILDDVWDEADGETVRVLCNEALPPGTDRIVTTRDAHLQTRIGGKLFPLDRLSRGDGVALLRDRLRGPGKPPGKKLLERLWKAVGGHALALELVAGRLLGSSLGTSFLSRLESAIRAGTLSHVARLTVDDPSKEMSVAVSFDLSWQDLLDADSRLGTHLAPRFARLAVFAEEAPITVDAAAAVWKVDPDQAEDTLAELTRRALLNHLGEREYSQHPLVHGYAVGRLREEAGAEAEAARRHLRFYRGVVAGFDETSWRETERQAANIAVAGARAANGLPAVAIGELGGPAPGTALRAFDVEAARDAKGLAMAARDYVWRRRVHEGRRWLEAGLAAARLLGDRRTEATLLTELGVWFNERGQRAMAERFFRSALERWEVLAASGERDDRYGLGRVLTNLGILSRAVDRQEEALALYQRALPIRRDIGDREGEQIVLGCIGVVHRDLGRHEEAIEHYRESLEIAEALGDLFGQSVNLNNWGRALRDLGRGEEAVELHERATELAERCGNDAGVAINRNNLGCVHYDQGAYEKALAELEKAVPIRESILDLPRLAVSYHNLGLTLGTLGRHDEALKRLDEALEIEKEVDDFAGRASTLYTRASLLYGLGRFEEAAAVLAEAERVLAERGLDRTSAGIPRAEIRDLLADWRRSECTPPRPAPPI
jgi:tetratricopeptide (TPR) repeat protein